MRAHPDAPGQGDHHVVALVASAGGLEAVTVILAGLREDFNAAVVVLIHQSPDRISNLAALLDRRCALPVSAAQHGAPLQPARVIVVPPGTHLLIAPGPRTVLIASGAAPPSRPSADLLLTTLATAVGDRAIAVVLSGGGHDAATGATAIHALGGTVMATDEASSTLFSMPHASIERSSGVDHVLPLTEIAACLNHLISGSP